MLHGPGNGPGKLVLFGPPDNVVSLLLLSASSILVVVGVDAVVATLQLLLLTHDDADEAGAYGPWFRFESRCGVFDALS